MKPLTAFALLDVWERGQRHSSLQRGLLLLAAAYPEVSGDALLDLTVGQVNRRLIALRALTFGATMDATADCPSCAERVEFTLDATELCQAESDEPTEQIAIEAAPDALFRVPRCRELLALQPGQGLDALLVQCLVNPDAEIDVSVWPAEQLAELANRMEAVDAHATMDLNLTCPACDHEWLAPFDVAGYLWKEVETWGPRLLREVHLLARAYGWTEHQVLSLRPSRRQYYLALASA